MAYADQQMSGNKVTALIIVALLHVAAGYALVTGLAYEAIEKVKQTVTAVNIEEPPPPPPPPPPEPDAPAPPPPPVAPPPMVKIERPAPPQIQTVSKPPPVIVIPVVTAPPPPPPPKFKPKDPVPRGNPGEWATQDDYPSRALRQEVEGRAGFRVTVGTNGRVESCQITSSSGDASLDEATCKFVSRRARFRPATDGDGNEVTGTYSNVIVWRIQR